MRAGNLFPLAIGLIWLLALAMAILIVSENAGCTDACMPVLQQLRALSIPSLVLVTVCATATLYARRERFSGWILGSVCTLLFFAWPVYWVSLTGGV